MPVETSVTRCGNCGATLERQPGVASLRCTYCQQATYLAPTGALPAAPWFMSAPPVTATTASLHDRLSHGPLGERVGTAMRYAPAQMRPLDVLAYERGFWPVGAHASSTYGGSWSPSALLGPPRVFPRYGDISGAWAPGPSRSPAEWVDIEYQADVPISAVRVFETNRAGSTYAIVDMTGAEQLIFADAPRDEGDARVLEVTIDPPRPLRHLRVYVVNPGWTELDTVGLLAAYPLPEPMRTRAAPLPSRNTSVPVILAAVVGLLVAIGVSTAMFGHSSASHPAAPPHPSQSIAGALMVFDTPEPSALAARNVTWASAVTDFSTEFSATRNAAADVVGPPDVYPRSGDIDGAWASRTTDFGPEWMTVRFGAPTLATSVVWVETFNPGAVVRVDDMSDPASPTVLWESTSTLPPSGSVVGELTLPSPRMISALRVVLDTRQVEGWNEIDAIGIVPAR